MISVLGHFAARNVKKLSVLFKVLIALKMLLANLQYEQHFFNRIRTAFKVDSVMRKES